jgi:ferrous iron transport protein B
MKLSDLHTGQSGIIVKVTGHGGFRKRIVEMGFIKGKKVEVLLNAPLRDPVKYKIMGYEVSLRHSEADLIEVMTEEEVRLRRKAQHTDLEPRCWHLTTSLPTSPRRMTISHSNRSASSSGRAAIAESKTINVALVAIPIV